MHIDIKIALSALGVVCVAICFPSRSARAQFFSPTKLLSLCLVATLWCLAESAQGFVTDGSFETPSIAANTFAYNPGGSPWTFTGNSGLINTPSAFASPPAPAGMQVAFLQTDGNNPGNFGQFSQTVNLPITGNYTLSYLDAGRNIPPSFLGNVKYEIWLGASLISTNATTSGQPFTPQTVPFSATAGLHSLLFRIDPLQPVGDNTAFFDRVSIGVPEPASAALAFFGMAVAAGGAYRRCRWVRADWK